MCILNIPLEHFIEVARARMYRDVNENGVALIYIDRYVERIQLLHESDGPKAPGARSLKPPRI